MPNKRKNPANQIPREWRKRMQNTLAQSQVQSQAQKLVGKASISTSKDLPAPPTDSATLDNIHRHPLLRLAEKVNKISTDVQLGFGFDPQLVAVLEHEVMGTAQQTQEGDIHDHLVEAGNYVHNLVDMLAKGAPFDEEYIAWFYMLQNLRRVPDEFDQYFVNLPAPDEALVLADGSIEHPLDYQYPSVTDGDYEPGQQTFVSPLLAEDNRTNARPLDRSKTETGYNYPAYPEVDDQDFPQRPFDGVCPVEGECDTDAPPDQSNALPGGLRQYKSGYNEINNAIDLPEVVRGVKIMSNVKREPPILNNNPYDGNIADEYDWEDRADGLMGGLVVGGGAPNDIGDHGLNELNAPEYGMDDFDYVTSQYDMPFPSSSSDAEVYSDFLLDSINPDEDFEDLDDGGYDIDEDDLLDEDDEDNDDDDLEFGDDVDAENYDNDNYAAEYHSPHQDVDVDFSGLTDDLLTDIVQNLGAISSYQPVAKAEDLAAKRSLQLQRRQELREQIKMYEQPKPAVKNDLSMRQILAAFQRARDVIMANDGGWVLTNVFFSGLSDEEVQALVDEKLIKVNAGKMTLTREGWEKPQFFQY